MVGEMEVVVEMVKVVVVAVDDVWTDREKGRSSRRRKEGREELTWRPDLKPNAADEEKKGGVSGGVTERKMRAM